MQHLIVRYHEISLKGNNRPFFIRQLVANLRSALAQVAGTAVRAEQGQIVIAVPDGAPTEEIHAAMLRSFGVAKYAFADRVGASMDELKAATSSLIARLPYQFETFRIATTRGDKRYPRKSPEVNVELGAFVQRLTGAQVVLKRPDLTIHVDIRTRYAFLYTDASRGPGGLPVGVSGRLVALLSGGIDSPVAAHHMMQRGCPVTFVHFHSFPLVDASSREKAEELVRILDGFQFGSRLYLVPFADVQRRIIGDVPPAYRVVAYRRFMVRIAEVFARSEGAGALVTGESVGQVASQTLENIASIDSVAQIPILRPLIGMDKSEIIERAQRIGTFETSILPDEDCCSLFVPKHPVLRSTPAAAERAEYSLPVDSLVRMAVDAAELITVGGKGR
ncbi:MAG: tRNA 4-thiouridine(8) synthase ThiI [Chloroflexi bacterium]|nr:tRNA 4-thiouridine(8) synthase ThiI [Chloroflexota bacterium]